MFPGFFSLVSQHVGVSFLGVPTKWCLLLGFPLEVYLQKKTSHPHARPPPSRRALTCEGLVAPDVAGAGGAQQCLAAATDAAAPGQRPAESVRRLLDARAFRVSQNGPSAGLNLIGN